MLDPSEAIRLPGVTLELRNPNGNVVATTTTDANGDYAFTGLPDGTYTVDVTDTANLLNGYWHSLGNQAPTSDGTSKADPYTLSVTGGQSVTTADFGYYIDPASLGDFVWQDTNGNGIQDALEPGIPAGSVTLTITNPDTSATKLVTTTDPNGLYAFDNLLLYERFDGVGTRVDEPTFVITVGTPPASHPAPVNQGANDAIDSDGSPQPPPPPKAPPTIPTTSASSPSATPTPTNTPTNTPPTHRPIHRPIHPPAQPTATNTPTARPTPPTNTPTNTPTRTPSPTLTPTGCPNCPTDQYEPDNSRQEAKPLPLNGIGQLHTFIS